MSERFIFPLYIGDYGQKTKHLSNTEDGIYILLMIHYWATGKPLPSDIDRLKNIAKIISGQEKSLDYILDYFFRKTACGYVHKRLQADLKAEIKRKKRRKKDAKKAADSRWQNNGLDAEGMDVTIHPHLPSHKKDLKENQSRKEKIVDNILNEEIESVTEEKRVMELVQVIGKDFIRNNVLIDRWASDRDYLKIISEIKEIKKVYFLNNNRYPPLKYYEKAIASRIGK